ncbi:hypothetical protein GCM10009713_33710 [Brevibacterium celere]
MPTLVGLIRRFIDDRQDVISSTVDEFHIFAEGDAVTAQLRVDDHLDPGVASNWYLEGEADDSRFYQVLSDHSLEFVKYTSVDQALYPQIDHLDASWRLVNVDEGGRIRTYEIPNQLELQSRAIDALSNLQGSLRFDASDLASYTVVSGNVIERFVYQSRRGLASDDTVEVHLLEDLDDFDLGFTAMQSSARFVVAIESVDDHGLEDLLVNRFFILSACSELRIVDDRDSLFSPVPFEASTGIFHEVRKDTNKYARSDIKANPSVTA